MEEGRMPHRSRPDHPRGRQPQPHEVLGLSSREDDAVKVIEIAQMMLRRWRRIPLADPGGSAARVGEARNRIRQIVAARQAMLEQIHARRRDG